MKLKKFLMGVFLMTGMGTYAHDFSITLDSQQLYYEITSKAKRTVAVTFKGSISERNENSLYGKLEIPSKVSHKNVVYQVTTIHAKAFAGAKRLKAVVIPLGVKSIGAFAFEGCDSLTSIVFPGNPVSFGQGVFFRCSSISDVTLGSDWKSVDFSMFRWSNQLKTVHIPAKVQKIKGFKKLKALINVTVDSNNSTFSAHKSMLYSKDGQIFYACPRSYEGFVTIKEGVESITPGALIDCLNVISIDFPSTLQHVSFRETSQMRKLEKLIMRPVQPVETAFQGGKGFFLMQIVPEKVEILVPSSAKKAYEEKMVLKTGEFTETSSSDIPYLVTENQISSKKHLKGVKNYKKYD